MIINPLLIAAISALIGVLFQHLYGIWKHKKCRNSGMAILKHQLEDQKAWLNELENGIIEQKVSVGLDSSAITSFINSDIVDLS